MLLSEINIPILRLAGAGEKTAALLEKKGLVTVGQLLQYWPRGWEDRQHENVLSDFSQHGKIAVYLTVDGFDYFGTARMQTLKILASDKNGQQCELVCFNRYFLKNAFPVGSKVFVYGHFEVKYARLQSSNFEIEHAEKAVRKILPVYRLTEGITQAKIRALMRQALKNYAKGLTHALPPEIADAHNIPDMPLILQYMHSPSDLSETVIATHAIIFEEFFLYQYALCMRSLQRRGRLPGLDKGGPCIKAGLVTKSIERDFADSLSPLQKLLLGRLPFRLTDDQKKVVLTCNADLQAGNTLSVLLQGDVGSGKTVVAFFCALSVIETGGQVAFLAPTELLAKQHAENAGKLLEPLGIRLAFLTGNIKAKGRNLVLKALREGELDLVVGTHALFSKDVRYKNLRLAVIDEQHRFGVMQRQAIIQKGIESDAGKKEPHIIMMSATPIPRSLTLSMFGDMDICTIHTKPIGRKPIITYVANKTHDSNVYNFVAEQIATGKQAYVVAPMIEEETDMRSVTELYRNLQTKFPKLKLGLLHSKMDTQEQQDTMLAFKAGTVQMLVATSIVEVGVDVPNANCIVIEQAERFGLAALHQLRGRVGRGSDQAYCFLIYGKGRSAELTETAFQRLKVLRDSTDGFEIAGKDLQLRGPGDILGVSQSGYNMGFTLADPARDYRILEEAMQASREYASKGFKV